ncbi:MAG: chromosome segregation protein SMC [Clostridia bacterium]|nr:chromosome segregation protein SMC [Clostridia bacterium]
MYLKRLEMQGFKSFVDKTILDFNKGITAVVGPNGSGKSNISDAVKWVLGEQSPKTLRGSRMEDVIFAGTESRKPVGMAEVSLIMDNEDRVLNIDFSEVKITRRLYRSGDSEYLINNAQCRMKDIHLLFADTGIGKDGYSLIGQGRVDEILNSKSDERRNIFEDASGIMKYRMRKAESERKLNLTEQNLLRVNDIVNELSHQIKPLEKQAETAKKYLDYKYALRDIEVNVLVDGIDFAEERLEKILKDIEILSADKQGAEALLEDIRKDNADKTEKAKILSDMLQATREKIYSDEKKIEKLKSEIEINKEKIKAAEDNKRRLLLEKEQQKQKSGVFDIRIAEMKQELAVLQKTLEEHLKESDKIQNTYNELQKQTEAIKQEVVLASEGILNVKLSQGKAQSAIESYNKQIELITDRKLSIDQELAVLESNSEIASGEIDAAEKERSLTEAKFEDTKQIYKNKSEALETAKQNEAKAVEKCAKISAALQSDSARLKAIKEMEDDYEGYAFSVKKVLSLCKSNPDFGKGICGAVAQIIRVSAEYETAIEVALAQAYQNIVTETEEDAKKAIEYLKKGRYGRATFLPLTAVNGRRFESETVKILEESVGYLGIASDLVDFDSKYQKAVDGLLGRVAVFNNLDNALKCASRNRYAFMCVTLEGDILRTSGAITGGSAEKGKSSAGTLSRTREIPALEKSVTLNQKLLNETNESVANYRSEVKSLELEREKLSGEVRSLEVSLSQWTAKCTAMREKQAGETARRGKLVEELKVQVHSMLDARKAIEEAQEEQKNLEVDLAKSEENLKMIEIKQEHSEKLLEDANQNLIRQKVKEANLKAAISKSEEDITRYEEAISEGAEHIEYYDSQVNDCEKIINQINSNCDMCNAEIEKVTALREENTANLSKYEALKNDLDEDLGGMLDKITEINEKITLYADGLNKAEIKKVREESEINSNKNRLWEEYELVFSAAKELTGGKRVENFPEASKKIKELKAQIKALGPVNVNAVEEYEATKERYTFMSAQKQDMDETKAKLQKIISELNGVMREQFMQQFKLIRENFKEVFTELFGGGKADIVLDETQDVLECGIEIQVQPPGKKLQNMMLLSGGERALTAIALLFGILKMHPSPFCLLDEIEAALDDANVYRLSDYLKKIKEEIQFIMITHRKGTMENACSLYGVTMEEKGISKVISLKMNE